MCKEKGAVIKSISPGSIAEELELYPGDKVLSINGQKLNDIIDYRYLISEEHIEILVERQGEQFILDVEKDSDEDMGLDFTSDLFNGLHKCSNKCVFCFVDQTPPKMRPQVYIKDDDYRMSFLYGNFITLNNVGNKAIERIIKLRLSPLYISIHTLNPEKRKLIFGIKKEDHIYRKLKTLVEGNIKLQTQIVLCPGINDGDDLDNTILKLSNFYPSVQSIAVVPVGLTKYRKDLYQVKSFDNDSASKVLNQVEKWQELFLEKLKTRLVYPADEFYILGEKDFPSFEAYEDFPQIENGVGMVADFLNPLNDFNENTKFSLNIKKKVTLVTGMLPVLNKVEYILKKVLNLEFQIIHCPSVFWGQSVTVSGLLTGSDIKKSLEGIDPGEEVIIPSNSIRRDGIFLDGITLEELSSHLGVPVKAVEGTVIDLLNTIGVKTERNNIWQNL